MQYSASILYLEVFYQNKNWHYTTRLFTSRVVKLLGTVRLSLLLFLYNFKLKRVYIKKR